MERTIKNELHRLISYVIVIINLIIPSALFGMQHSCKPQSINTNSQSIPPALPQGAAAAGALRSSSPDISATQGDSGDGDNDYEAYSDDHWDEFYAKRDADQAELHADTASTVLALFDQECPAAAGAGAGADSSSATPSARAGAKANPHNKKRKPNDVFTCNNCNQTFQTSKSLTFHTKIMHGQKPFKCNSCTHAFSKQNDLNSHKAWHEDPTKHIGCEICGRTWPDSPSGKIGLKAHKKTHQSYNPTSASAAGLPSVVLPVLGNSKSAVETQKGAGANASGATSAATNKPPQKKRKISKETASSPSTQSTAPNVQFGDSESFATSIASTSAGASAKASATNFIEFTLVPVTQSQIQMLATQAALSVFANTK